MKISLPSTPTQFAPSAGKGKGQLAALAELTTKMRTIRRDLQMPEEEKRRQIAMLREQTQAIQQAVTDKIETKQKASLVDSSTEAANAVEGAADSVKYGSTGDASEAVSSEQSAQSASASPSTTSASGGANSGGSTLGTIVDTYV